MDLIRKPIVDLNIASSSGGDSAGPSQTRGRIVPPIVFIAGPLSPNIIARCRQPPKEALDTMEEDSAPVRDEKCSPSAE